LAQSFSDSCWRGGYGSSSAYCTLSTAPAVIAALSIPALFFAQLGVMSILLARFAWQRRGKALTA
jgi:hypothetical protein